MATALGLPASVHGLTAEEWKEFVDLESASIHSFSEHKGDQ